MALVGNEKDFLPITRPHWIEFHVVLAIVVSWEITSCFTRQPDNIPQLSVPHIRAKNVKPFIELRRDKNNLLTIRRPARFHIHRAAIREQLAGIVSAHEAELKVLERFKKAIPAEDLRRVERALAEAKARLAAEH